MPQRHFRGSGPHVAQPSGLDNAPQDNRSLGRPSSAASSLQTSGSPELPHPGPITAGSHPSAGTTVTMRPEQLVAKVPRHRLDVFSPCAGGTSLTWQIFLQQKQFLFTLCALPLCTSVYFIVSCKEGTPRPEHGSHVYHKVPHFHQQCSLHLGHRAHAAMPRKPPRRPPCPGAISASQRLKL